MLFVFGYRANKIRSKKIAELIHNSNEHPHCSSCTVSVHFQQIIDKVYKYKFGYCTMKENITFCT